MSLVFILPLVVLYQIGIVQNGSEVRNLAEVWMTGPIALLGVSAAAVVNVLLLAGVVLALWRMQRTGAMSMVFALFMVLESLIYALLLFGGVGVIAQVLDRTVHNLLVVGSVHGVLARLPVQQLLLGIGAGVYEELLFRVLMVGGGVLVLTRVLKVGRWAGVTLVLLASSLVFSAVHHLGSAGEPFCSYVFIFRALCGVVLGVIFLVRGPGIPVMTHAVYNVMVILAVAM